MPITSNRARLGPLKQSFSRESRRFSWIKYNQGTEDQRAGAPPNEARAAVIWAGFFMGKRMRMSKRRAGQVPALLVGSLRSVKSEWVRSPACHPLQKGSPARG